MFVLPGTELRNFNILWSYTWQASRRLRDINFPNITFNEGKLFLFPALVFCWISDWLNLSVQYFFGGFYSIALRCTSTLILDLFNTHSSIWQAMLQLLIMFYKQNKTYTTFWLYLEVPSKARGCSTNSAIFGSVIV